MTGETDIDAITPKIASIYVGEMLYREVCCCCFRIRASFFG